MRRIEKILRQFNFRAWDKFLVLPPYFLSGLIFFATSSVAVEVPKNPKIDLGGSAQELRFYSQNGEGEAQNQPRYEHPRPHPEHPRLHPKRFDFYILALSWSPTFCSLYNHRFFPEQCREGPHSGFVLHGLWPQYLRGFPSYCAHRHFLSKAALSEMKDLFPALKLARYTWTKHGTCSGESPEIYFAQTRAALQKIIVPPLFHDSDQTRHLTYKDIENAFIHSNPGLQADMMAVVCKKHILKEIRICFSNHLEGFQVCPRISRNRCRTPLIQMPGLRGK